jgi:hypothetical protein
MPQLMELLLDKGADIQGQDEDHASTLQLTSGRGYPEQVTLAVLI